MWLRKPKCGVLETEMFHTCYRLQENERLYLYIRRKVKQSILLKRRVNQDYLYMPKLGVMNLAWVENL